MYYKHLKDFFEQSSQKAFWILSYAHVAGMVLGFFAAHYLSDLLPWAPGLVLYPLGLAAGLALTWVQAGQPIYQIVLLWLLFQLRRLLTAQTLLVNSRQYYARRQAPTRPFALSGRVSYSGEESSGQHGRLVVGHFGVVAASVTPGMPSSPRVPALTANTDPAGGSPLDVDERIA
jgi:hypothetical protein